MTTLRDIVSAAAPGRNLNRRHGILAAPEKPALLVHALPAAVNLAVNAGYLAGTITAAAVTIAAAISADQAALARAHEITILPSELQFVEFHLRRPHRAQSENIPHRRPPCPAAGIMGPGPGRRDPNLRPRTRVGLKRVPGLHRAALGCRRGGGEEGPGGVAVGARRRVVAPRAAAPAARCGG